MKVFIYEGNRCDKGTIEEVMVEIERTFPRSEITIVLDRGMITKKNLQYIEAMGYKYIIALRKTDSADIVNSPLNEAEMQPLKEGQYVRLFETLTDRYDEKEITRDAIYDGVYVLRTNKEGLSSEEIVGAYKQLMRVEMAFRCLIIVHKVTKKIDEETRQSLSALGIKTIKAERMYWQK